MWWLEQTFDDFQGFNVSKLNVDEAWVNISTSLNEPVWLYTLSQNCFKCPNQKFLEDPIVPHQSVKAIINTRYPLSFRFRTVGNSTFANTENDSYKVCDVHGTFGEFGVYSIHANEFDAVEKIQCTLETELEPVNIYLPIIIVFAFWIILFGIWKFIASHMSTVLNAHQGLVSRFCGNPFERLEPPDQREREIVEPPQTPPNVSAPPPSTNTTKSQPIDKRSRNQRRRKDASGHARLRDSPGKLIPSPSCQTETLSATATTPNTLGREPTTSSGSLSVAALVQNGTPKQRLKCLDVFRGLCILIMIFVDDGGGGYYFFQHCAWDGLYVADLAFPWFLWICGVCIPFSIHSRQMSGYSKRAIFNEILKRSLKLIFLGILVNTSTKPSPVQLEQLRLPGVLQRFGICYFIGSVLLLLCSTKLDSSSDSNGGRENQRQRSTRLRSYVTEIQTTLIIPWTIVLACVALHTSFSFRLNVPGCPIGYLGPAGLHENNSFPPECVGGAAGYIDRLILGIQHIHNRPTSKAVYGSAAFDPEGTLGILTSILTVWLGVQSGITFLLCKCWKARLWRLAWWSFLCGTLGLALCGGIDNEGWIPVNKNLWSLSFVLVTSSGALVLLGTFYLVVDVNGFWSGSPLVETGMNSILLYLGHEVCHAMLPWHFSYGRMRTHSSKLFESCWGTALWICVAMYLHSRKMFLIV